jgi:hypothetical protein
VGVEAQGVEQRGCDELPRECAAVLCGHRRRNHEADKSGGEVADLERTRRDGSLHLPVPVYLEQMDTQPGIPLDTKTFLIGKIADLKATRAISLMAPQSEGEEEEEEPSEKKKKKKKKQKNQKKPDPPTVTTAEEASRCITERVCWQWMWGSEARQDEDHLLSTFLGGRVSFRCPDNKPGNRSGARNPKLGSPRALVVSGLSLVTSQKMETAHQAFREYATEILESLAPGDLEEGVLEAAKRLIKDDDQWTPFLGNVLTKRSVSGPSSRISSA